jgi:hypothetical protein
LSKVGVAVVRLSVVRLFSIVSIVSALYSFLFIQYTISFSLNFFFFNQRHLIKTKNKKEKRSRSTHYRQSENEYPEDKLDY